MKIRRILNLAVVLVFTSALALAQTNTVTSTVTGTTTVDKTPPTASAPSVVINNQDVCTSAASAAVQTQILGIATGVTVTDENCERLKLARSLYGMGMKVAAVSMLCQDERVFDAMHMAGTPCPFEGKIGEEAQRLWEAELAKEEEETVDEAVSAQDAGIPMLLMLLLFLL
jgi:hypothetical protein